MNRLRRVKDSIERRRDFTEARRILDNAPNAFLDSREFATQKSIRDIDEDRTLISRDRGNGRASSGIRFLELVSISFAGKNLDSMVKFDTVPIYVNLRVFYFTELSDLDKSLTIARSLGVEEFLEMLRIQRSELFSEAITRFKEVFEEVKSGSFRFSNNRRLLSFCRLLVDRALVKQREKRIRGEG